MTPTSSATAAAIEVARIRAHFSRALSFLDCSTAIRTAAQRRTRKLLRNELVGYRLRGRFPQNRDFPFTREPYFVDADGTHCAVAHLMSQTGAATLVEDIARTRNHARVAELASDPRRAALRRHKDTWLDRRERSEGDRDTR